MGTRRARATAVSATKASGVSPLSDEALLAGFAARDPEAAAGFVRRFQARVYGLALTIVRDRAIAEDVAQETFVRAWKQAGSYDPRRGRVLTWLLAIARNRAIDVTRLRASRPLDPDVVTARLELERQATGDVDESTRVDERETVREALADLPAEQRRALVLAVYFGRTAGEISELDGVALGTVKWRIRQAMIKLRKEVGEPHVD
jgi:RNA polymerase sigma factor (sigma-70 family)